MGQTFHRYARRFVMPEVAAWPKTQGPDRCRLREPPTTVAAPTLGGIEGFLARSGRSVSLSKFFFVVAPVALFAATLAEIRSTVDSRCCVTEFAVQIGRTMCAFGKQAARHLDRFVTYTRAPAMWLHSNGKKLKMGPRKVPG